MNFVVHFFLHTTSSSKQAMYIWRRPCAFKKQTGSLLFEYELHKKIHSLISKHNDDNPWICFLSSSSIQTKRWFNIVLLTVIINYNFSQWLFTPTPANTKNGLNFPVCHLMRLNRKSLLHIITKRLKHTLTGWRTIVILHICMY